MKPWVCKWASHNESELLVEASLHEVPCGQGVGKLETNNHPAKNGTTAGDTGRGKDG
jgi:hypothetical protein